MMQVGRLGILAATALLGGAAQVVTVYTSDFIPDGSRTGFNGFESIPNDGTEYTGGSGACTEGGIAVEQINDDPGNTIWVNYRPPGGEGAHGWYPDGGDHGCTRIRLTGGGSFSDVGMLVSTGFAGTPTMGYEL